MDVVLAKSANARRTYRQYWGKWQAWAKSREVPAARARPRTWRPSSPT